MEISATGTNPEDSRQSLLVVLKALGIAHGGIKKGPIRTLLLPDYGTQGCFTHRSVCSVEVPMPAMAHLEAMSEAAGYQ